MLVAPVVALEPCIIPFWWAAAEMAGAAINAVAVSSATRSPVILVCDLMSSPPVEV
jgi:hypothetical protein